MDEKDILLFETIISDLTTFENKCIERFKGANRIIIEQFKTNYTKQGESFQSTSTDLTNTFLKIKNYSEAQNKLLSCDLNVFRMFGVGETLHSYILGNFLNPYGEHGQKHLFLNIFLDLLNVKRFSESENWIVTVEKGRIDVLLKRVHPHSVIIIENKSNYASDQENQIYRYWYQEIYTTICDRYLPSGYILNPPDNYYQLIYLSPAHWKIPGNNSLKRPSNWATELPDEVPLKTKHLLFTDFIVHWLTLSLDKLQNENHRLREYIRQYLELWK